MDTRAHFSICRDCALIFQNPLIHSLSTEDLGFMDWSLPDTASISAKEPLEWLRQFTRRGKQSARALEVYHQKPCFQDTLLAEGWNITALPVKNMIPSDGDITPAADLPEGESFDLIFCFDVLDKIPRPLDLLTQLHKYLKSDGGLYVETFNPSVAPRLNQICLTSENACIFTFHSLIYSLYKAGFTNQAAEHCGNMRYFCTKIEPNPEADATKLVPNNYWSHILYRFHRNHYWAWTSGFLNRYTTQAQNRPEFLNQTRDLLHQRLEDLSIIRDVCGSVLLFVQEIDTVRRTIAQDWSLTMQRIFNIFCNDYALYDILRTGAPIQDLGTMPGIERFYFNYKMIFMTDIDYFERFFTQEEAGRLCDSIIQSGEVVCKTLSSFL